MAITIFPIGAHTPDFYVTVVDEAGNALSETIFIQHRQGVARGLLMSPCGMDRHAVSDT